MKQKTNIAFRNNGKTCNYILMAITLISVINKMELLDLKNTIIQLT